MGRRVQGQRAVSDGSKNWNPTPSVGAGSRWDLQPQRLAAKQLLALLPTNVRLTAVAGASPSLKTPDSNVF